MTKKSKIQFETLDNNISPEILKKYENGEDFELPTQTPLIKNILDSITKTEKVQRLALEEDPRGVNRFLGIYYDKVGQLPDILLKRVANTDDLVGNILHIRGNQASVFGQVLEDRFEWGFRVEPKPQKFKNLPKEKQEELRKKMNKAQELLATCGHTDSTDEDEEMSLSTFLYISARNSLLFGRFATEILHRRDMQGNKTGFYAFRPVDAGTIFKAVPNDVMDSNIRKEAIRTLNRIKNVKLDPKKFAADSYKFFQIINGTPAQGFESDELIVKNCYPSTDIENNGYPITPIDLAFAAVSTHINITNHNKLYFQNGRAAKGMLVITSDEVDQGTVADLKQQFNAAINSVANSWKTPVIRVGKEDDVQWRAMDAQSKDGEFQYLYDSNCRVVLASFQMSPDEVPGYSHLSRGSNTQTLSESNSEYKLEAHRDVGIRPMLANLQDFLSTKILPLIDEEVGEYCRVTFHGLETDSPDKERTAIQEWAPLWGTMDEVLDKVERPKIGKKMGGEFPFNELFQGVLDKYFTVGQIIEHFFGVEGASKKKEYNYIRDQYWFTQQSLVMQEKQNEEQKKMAEEQMKQQQQMQQQEVSKQKQADSKSNELVSGINQLESLLTRSELSKKEKDSIKGFLSKIKGE